MFRVHCFGFTFTPKLVPTIFLFIALPILIGLGIWQWHRADEKHQLVTQFKSRHLTALPLKEVDKQALKSLAYRTVRITGHYDNAHQLLLDNKIHRHRVGYEVLTPFIPNHGDRLVIVNRGWITSTGNRQQLPTIPASRGQQTIQGLIKLPPKRPFVLQDDRYNGQWPLLIQALDLQKIAKAYHKPLYPFVVLLSPKASGGFLREWHPVVMTPAKHIAYAIQWFALSLTLAIIYFLLSTKRQRGRHDKPKPR